MVSNEKVPPEKVEESGFDDAYNNVNAKFLLQALVSMHTPGPGRKRGAGPWSKLLFLPQPSIEQVRLSNEST